MKKDAAASFFIACKPPLPASERVYQRKVAWVDREPRDAHRVR